MAFVPPRCQAPFLNRYGKWMLRLLSSAGVRSVSGPCSCNQGTVKEGLLNCDERMAKSCACVLKVAQRPVRIWEVQHTDYSFPLLEQKYFAPAFHRKGIHRREFANTWSFVVYQARKSSQKTDGKCMSTILIKFIYIIHF